MFKLIKKLFGLIFKKHDKCFYMNSANILPPPLDEEKETEMLLKVAAKDLEARNTLIIHNLRLVVFIAKKFESTKIPLDDLVSIGTLGLIKGIETFKLDKRDEKILFSLYDISITYIKECNYEAQRTDQFVCQPVA